MEQVKRQIIAAACKYGETIIVGVRHYDKIMTSQLRMFPEDSEVKMMNRGEVIQGFIDNHGNFLNRQEAMELVKSNGQPFYPIRNSGNGKELYSEGVW